MQAAGKHRRKRLDALNNTDLYTNEKDNLLLLKQKYIMTSIIKTLIE